MKASSQILVGWAAADITPGESVELRGQFHTRVSEGIRDRITATALAISPAAGSAGDAAVLVSCDLVSISDSLNRAVRAELAEQLPELPAMSVVLNGTHTHTAPEASLPEDNLKNGGGISSANMDLGLAAMCPADYVTFAAGRIAGAVVVAWRSRESGSIAYGLGHAVVGHNRRSVYEGGISRMYGDTTADDFSHIEGYEDHSLNVLATWSECGELTGLILNVACPSQVSEHEFTISADYWHDVRVELRRRLGKDLFVLPQCSAAGDQSPHVQVGKSAEARMLKLRGCTRRQEIARRVADAVEGLLPAIETQRRRSATLRHHADLVELPRRRISQGDVDEAMAEASALMCEYKRLRAEIETDASLRNKPRWYVDITRNYRRAMWCEGVARRFEIEKTSPNMPVELHVVRIGDIAIATNPFELYLDYGIRIKARSPAIQTFVVQLAGPGTYLPTERAVTGKSYGAMPASTPVGPQGGRELVEWTIRMLRAQWNTQ